MSVSASGVEWSGAEARMVPGPCGPPELDGQAVYAEANRWKGMDSTLERMSFVNRL
jgi:hypothetical protein